MKLAHVRISSRRTPAKVESNLNGDTFWQPNRTFSAQKNGQGELTRRQGRLFLILKTGINQKMQKKFRVRGTLNRRRTTITIQYNLTQETKEAHNVSLIDKNSLHEKKETYQEVKNTGKDGSELDPSADSTRDNVLLMTD